MHGRKAEDDGDSTVRLLFPIQYESERALMNPIGSFINCDFKVSADDGKKYTYLELPQSARDKFDEKRLQYGFFRDLDTVQERDMFYAVQQGKVLSKGGTSALSFFSFFIGN